MSSPLLSQEAVVLSGTGGVWVVRTTGGETLDVSLKGRLKRDRDPRRDERSGNLVRAASDDTKTLKLAVGDRVTVESTETAGGWVISTIHERSSKLSRRAPGGARGERVLVANVDQVLVVFAVARPEPNLRMLDRFLVIAEANDLAACIVVNKIDIAESKWYEELFGGYRELGYQLLFTSARRGDELALLRAQIEGRISVLTGPSGVGKSSLMNALFPGLVLRTQEISESVNKGRHTTVGATLFALPCGGFIADTPGLREVGLWGIEPSGIPECFPEFRPYLNECRFTDCTHRVEPGCAVRDALDAGNISSERYQSYLRLREELESGVRDDWETRS